jgi:predicted  nucleic acid-binding Zn-ribbon protein
LTWDPRGGPPPAQAGSGSKIRTGARQGYGPPPHVKPRTPWKEAGQVTSPQQPPPGAAAHTKPGVHETRDAPSTVSAAFLAVRWRGPLWGDVTPMSITKKDSTIPTSKASKVPDWIDGLRASLERQRRLQQRLRRLDRLEHLTRARDAMIDAATRRKSGELQIRLRLNDLQQKKSDLQQKESDLQRQMNDLEQQESDLQQKESDLRQQESDRKSQTGDAIEALHGTVGYQRALSKLKRQIKDLEMPRTVLRAEEKSLRAEEASLPGEEESLRAEEASLRAEEEERTVAYRRLQAEAEASQAAVDRFETARAEAIKELTTSGVLDGTSAQPDYEAHRIWLKLQAEQFIVCSGGLLDRIWMILQSLFIPTVPVATVLTAATAEDAADAVLQLYMWERDRLLTLAKGAGGAAVTVLAGLIATGFAGKTGVNSATIFVAAPLVAILLFWAGFLLAGLRGLADQYPIARELAER